MTLHATLSKDLTSLVSELEAHISANGLDEAALNAPYVPLVDLGSPSTLVNDIPSLANLLSGTGLTIKTINLYAVYIVEVVSTLNVPYLIVPIRNGANADLVLHEVNEGAVASTSDLGYPFYFPESTTDVETIALSPADTIHLVNANTNHSFRYSIDTTTMTQPSTLEDVVLLLMFTVNEDLSGYFS